jgi:hypothetical protein
VLSEGTRRTYLAGTNCFLRFMSSIGALPASSLVLPLSPQVKDAIYLALHNAEVLSGFVVFCWQQKLQSSTVQVYLAGVRAAVATHSRAPPALPPATSRLLLGYERLAVSDLPAISAPRPAVPRELVHELCAVLLRCPDTFLGLLGAALVATGFAACLRVSEYLDAGRVDKLLTLACVSADASVTPKDSNDWLRTLHSQLALPAQGPVLLLIRRAKANQLGPPQRVLVHPDSSAGPTCPAHILRSYLAARLARLTPRSSTEAVFVLPSGERARPIWFNALLKQTLSQMGVADAAKYSAHCLRIGAATSAALQGASADEIKALGRWRSVAYRGYIRPTGQPTPAPASTLQPRA